MKINLNNSIVVRLTDAGEIAWSRYWNETSTIFGEVGVPVAIRESTTEKDGRVRFQLWQAMAIFGDNCYNGSQELPFVNNQIEILEAQ